MRYALIDTDIVAFSVSARDDEEVDFGNGTIAKTVDKQSCWKWCDDIIESHCDATKSDVAVVCLSDPDGQLSE